MFWRKKQVAVAVGAGAAAIAPVGAELVTPKVEVQKQSSEKLHGPQELPFKVGRDIVVQLHKEPDWVWSLQAVLRKNPTMGKHVLDIRIFSQADAARKGIKVKDYTTFDSQPDLILFEGWFDSGTNETHLVERKAE